MKTFILLLMVCYLNPNGQESCMPLVEEPTIYYPTSEVCNLASVEKRKNMQIISEQYLQVTQVYSTCIEDNRKLPV